MDGGLRRCGNRKPTYRKRIERRAGSIERSVRQTISWRGRSWEELLTLVLVVGGLRLASTGGLIVFSPLTLTLTDLLAANSVGSVVALVAYLAVAWLRRHDARTRRICRYVRARIRRHLLPIPLRSPTPLEEATAARRFARRHPARIVWNVLRRVQVIDAHVRALVPFGGWALRPRL